MRFWELTSAFREEENILKIVLLQSKWKSFLDNYENLEAIVRRQNREILGQEIPHQLLFEVCSKSHKKFWYYPNREPKLLSTFPWQLKSSNELFEILNALDVLNRFGGSIIEEVHERSYTEVA
jgi:hypothetical protein